MGLAAHDDVIHDFDLEQLTRPDQIARHSNVCLARCWIGRGVVVHQNQARRGLSDGGSEDVQRRHWAGVMASQSHQIMAEDAFAGIEPSTTIIFPHQRQ